MDSALLNFLAAAVIVLVAAMLGGSLPIRLGQPSVLGSLLFGLLLPPTLPTMPAPRPLLLRHRVSRVGYRACKRRPWWQVSSSCW